MSDKTHISWTDTTWNPVSGCTKVSAGCDRCYIERTPPFRMKGRRFDKPGIGGTTGVVLHPDRLEQPLHWRNPRMVFVNSLSDLFHAEVPDDYVAQIFQVMAETPWHTYQILTKRPGPMLSLLGRATFGARLERLGYTWPLPNVWLGVSAESQEWADRRVPLLIETPAVVRFVSAEPLLLGLNLWDFMNPRRLDWVIVGGESGPGARRMAPEWAGSLRAQCYAAGVAFHFKQYGSVTARALGLKHRAGADPAEWPIDWPREYPAGVTA